MRFGCHDEPPRGALSAGLMNCSPRIDAASAIRQIVA
jgi:hypothetical protein